MSLGETIGADLRPQELVGVESLPTERQSGKMAFARLSKKEATVSLIVVLPLEHLQQT